MSSTENDHGYRIEALGPQTWDAFADLAGRHNGVWGGCWCTYFHRGVDDAEHTQSATRRTSSGSSNRAAPTRRRCSMATSRSVGREFGTVEELPNIHHRKEWEQGLRTAPRLPHYLSVRRPAVPPQGSCGDSRPWRLGADRHRRRRARRGLPARSPARQEDVGVVSLQRHPDDVRTARVHLPATEGTGQLRHDQGDPRQPRRRGAASPLTDQPTPVSRYRAMADATPPPAARCLVRRHRPQGLEVCRRSRLRVLLHIRASQRPASTAHAPTVPVTTETSVTEGDAVIAAGLLGAANRRPANDPNQLEPLSGRVRMTHRITPTASIQERRYRRVELCGYLPTKSSALFSAITAWLPDGSA